MPKRPPFRATSCPGWGRGMTCQVGHWTNFQQLEAEDQMIWVIWPKMFWPYGCKAIQLAQKPSRPETKSGRRQSTMIIYVVVHISTFFFCLLPVLAFHTLSICHESCFSSLQFSPYPFWNHEIVGYVKIRLTTVATGDGVSFDQRTVCLRGKPDCCVLPVWVQRCGDRSGPSLILACDLRYSFCAIMFNVFWIV